MYKMEIRIKKKKKERDPELYCKNIECLELTSKKYCSIHFKEYKKKDIICDGCKEDGVSNRGKINLVCLTCNRYYCDCCWTEADDQYFMHEYNEKTLFYECKECDSDGVNLPVTNISYSFFIK